MTDVVRNVPVIGLVGGVGAGKSHVARRVSSLRSGLVITADEIGHQVLTFPTVKDRLRREWGEAIFDKHGAIDRKHVGQLVFGDSPAAVQRRELLESIVHPLITEEMHRQISSAREQPGINAVFLDAPLLLEAGWNEFCDVVVFVESSPANRLERVTRTRGWTQEELERREASQLPLEAKRAKCDFSIHNDDSLRGSEELVQILDQISLQDSQTP